MHQQAQPHPVSSDSSLHSPAPHARTPEALHPVRIGTDNLSDTSDAQRIVHSLHADRDAWQQAITQGEQE